MKWQRNTVVLVGIAIALSLGVFISETQRRSSNTAEPDLLAQPTGDPIVSFKEEDVTTLTLNRAGQTLQFERNAEAEWQMVKPETALAEPGAIAFLLNAITTEPAQQTITIEASRLEEFGLANPTTTVVVTLANGETHTLALGAEDFSQTSVYVQLDPPAASDPTSEITLYIVSGNVINGVDRPLAEWKAVTDIPVSEESTPSYDNSPTNEPSDRLPPAPDVPGSEDDKTPSPEAPSPDNAPPNAE